MTARAAFEARLATDIAAAGSAERVPGGTLLRTPDLPLCYDLNQLVCDPGAGAEEIAEAIALTERVYAGFPARRMTIFDPASEPVVPAGWQVDPSLLMRAPATAPPWPPEVSDVPAAALHGVRTRLWREDGEEVPEQVTAMQEAFAAFEGARTVAVAQKGAWVAWAQISNGGIDDVWVQEPYRGRGLGRLVVRAAVAAGGWFLWTSSGDPRPQGLYRSEGFTEIGRVVQLLHRPG